MTGLGVAAAAGFLTAPEHEVNAHGRLFRIRALTAGVALDAFTERARVDAVLATLVAAKARFESAGYEVQTLRIATPSLLGTASTQQRRTALPAIQQLDETVRARGAVLSVGSVLTVDRAEPGLAAWATDLVQSTRAVSFSVTVASPTGGQHRQAAVTAAGVIAALSRAATGGVANFRFAAAANVPPGTPFFPVAHHDGTDALAVGLESPRLVREAIRAGSGRESAEQRIREAIDAELAPIATLATACANDAGHRYLGIDPSPAPGADSSIADAIEALTGQPFGAASTLDACATITGALKQLKATTCGYAGLMLPVLEDPVLARRAAEGKFGVRDLLLFSSVCGTGLDVVPLPGDTSTDLMARLIEDVAAMAVRLRKPLSARLFPVPGKAAGDDVTFDDPLLSRSVALRVD
jgi:uncharacterized protein (UPF0210 family)